MESELRLLETAALPFEAEHMQQVLAAAGIDSYLEGVSGASTFGLNATMGTIRIKVRNQDWPQARQALSDSMNSVGQAWYCGTCQETNEANFDLCWKCQGERSQVEVEPPGPSAPEESTEPVDYRSPQPVAADYNPRPYAPPTTEPTRPSLPLDPSVPTADQAEYEETIERAYRASIFGLITVPVLFHIYSFVLLLGALSLRAQTTPRLSWRFAIAMVINLAVFFAVGWIALGLMASG